MMMTGNIKNNVPVAVELKGHVQSLKEYTHVIGSPAKERLIMKGINSAHELGIKKEGRVDKWIGTKECGWMLTVRDIC